MDDALFIRSLLTDTIVLRPHELSANYVDFLQAHIERQFGGRCSRHGFIEPGSIHIKSVTDAYVMSHALNGNVQFDVSYFANVCNPPVDAIIPARVVNRNSFGVMAHSGITRGDGDFLPVAECFVTPQVEESMVDLDTLETGETVLVEVIGKRFELGDRKLTVLGRVVTAEYRGRQLKAAATAPTTTATAPTTTATAPTTTATAPTTTATAATATPEHRAAATPMDAFTTPAAA